MSAGVVLLGQVAARLPVFDLACNRCDSRGRLRTARLVAEHGPDMPGPDLLRVLSADCPRRQMMEQGQLADPCGIHCPGLAATR
jgi:hypothetical protein